MKIIALPIFLSIITACSQHGVPSDGYETDTYLTPNKKAIHIHALTHASIRIDYEGHEIEIDPVSKMGDKVIDYGKFPKADFIIVTHEHFDHFDTAAIQALSKEETQLITNQRCAEMLGYGTVMANGDKHVINNWLTIEAVPAYNTTEGRQQFHPQGRDNGFILTIDGFRIYIAGDTEDIPEMANIKNIDVAFLPCNQPYTMTVDQLVQTAKVIKPAVVYPYHYGQTDVSGIPALLKNEGIDVFIRHFE